MKTIGGIQPKI